MFHVNQPKPNLELFQSNIFGKKKDSHIYQKNAEETNSTVKYSLDWLHSIKIYLERAGKN